MHQLHQSRTRYMAPARKPLNIVPPRDIFVDFFRSAEEKFLPLSIQMPVVIQIVDIEFETTVPYFLNVRIRDIVSLLGDNLEQTLLFRTHASSDP